MLVCVCVCVYVHVRVYVCVCTYSCISSAKGQTTADPNDNRRVVITELKIIFKDRPGGDVTYALHTQVLTNVCKCVYTHVFIHTYVQICIYEHIYI